MHVPCAQATVSRFARRGWLTTLSSGRLAVSAVEEVRARLAEREEDEEGSGDLKRRLDMAMARIREAQAQLREYELAEESGRLVELALVQKDAADARERVLGVLRAIAQRVALAVDAALSAPLDRRAAVIEGIINAEIERAIAELAEAKYGGRK